MPALGAVTNLSSVALQDVADGGYRGSSPITFTFNQLQANPRRIGGNPAVSEYELTPTWDGTNAPIVITGLT